MGQKSAITMVIDPGEIPGPEGDPDPPQDPPVDPDPPQDPPVDLDPPQDPPVDHGKKDDEWRNQMENRLDQIQAEVKKIPQQVVSSLEKKKINRKTSQRKSRRRRLNL